MPLRNRLLPLIALPLMGLAAPESAPAEALPEATVQILDRELVPGRVAVPSGQFRIHNRAAAAARVEFDLPRGDGLVCETASDAPRRARKFVVAPGEALACTGEGSELRYEVSRAVRLTSGRYEHQRDAGRIAFE